MNKIKLKRGKFRTSRPERLSTKPEQIVAMAAYANKNIPVDGWIVLHPLFRGVDLLSSPYAVVFADALPLVFPVTDAHQWSNSGPLMIMRRRLREVLNKAPAVITFSRHVAADVSGVLGIKHSNIHVIPHSTPSVSEHLPFVPASDPRATPASRRHAADILRACTLSRTNKYLHDYPFEDTKYFVVSTQDRVTKNIGLAAEACVQLIRADMADVKMITTAPINWGIAWTRLPTLIDQNQIFLDVLSVNDLPRPAHAALYHCAQLTVAPSFFEGGHAVFPFYEALSVGCPCIMARGPHTEEAISSEPDLERYLFDPYDSDSLAHMIKAIIRDRDAVLDHQLSILEKLRMRTWGDVARAYGDAAVSGSQLPLKKSHY